MLKYLWINRLVRRQDHDERRFRITGRPRQFPGQLPVIFAIEDISVGREHVRRGPDGPHSHPQSLQLADEQVSLFVALAEHDDMDIVGLAMFGSSLARDFADSSGVLAAFARRPSVADFVRIGTCAQH